MTGVIDIHLKHGMTGERGPIQRVCLCDVVAVVMGVYHADKGWAVLLAHLWDRDIHVSKYTHIPFK